MNRFGMIMMTGFLMLNLTSAMAGEPAKVISVDTFMRRFKISYEIFSLSADGKRLLNSENNGWVSQDNVGPIEKELSMIILSGNEDHADSRALIVKVMLHDDGQVTAHFEEYRRKDISVQKDGKTVGKNPINVTDQTLVDFSTFTYPFKDMVTKRSVVRFVPDLMPEKTSSELKDIPLAGDEMVMFDSKGHVWANNFSITTPYFAVLTEKGALMLSYNRFEGSEESGYVDGSKAHVNLKDGTKFTLTSTSPMLPRDVIGKLYARFFTGIRKPMGGYYTIVTENTAEKALKDIRNCMQ